MSGCLLNPSAQVFVPGAKAHGLQPPTPPDEADLQAQLCKSMQARAAARRNAVRERCIADMRKHIEYRNRSLKEADKLCLEYKEWIEELRQKGAARASGHPQVEGVD